MDNEFTYELPSGIYNIDTANGIFDWRSLPDNGADADITELERLFKL